MKEFVEAEEPIIPQYLSREIALRMLLAQGHEEKSSFIRKFGLSENQDLYLRSLL